MTIRRYIFGTVLVMLAWTINIFANRITDENSLPGTRDWQITKEFAYDHQIEGYASAASVNVGEGITFYVNLGDGSSHYDLEIYRMGWYNGDGGRLVFTRTRIISTLQAIPYADHQTGLAECNWIYPGGFAQSTWSVPTTAVSGYYIAKIRSVGSRRFASYVPFTVRDDARVSDFLFQASVTTWQAYNFWPGSLYADNEDWRNGKSLYFNPNEPLLVNQASWGPAIPEGHINGRQARAVSFNRPYTADNNSPYYTAGQFFIRGEYNMVRWMEKQGYDVTYTTDVDTDAATDMVNGPLSPGRHKVFLSVGHDEYWSWQMRENLEQARNRTNQPLNIGWFGANSVYWQIRFANSSSTNTNPANIPRRTMIAYKELATSSDLLWKDPLFTDGGSQTNYLTTTLWRNMKTDARLGTQCPFSNCFKNPEDEIVGVMTNLANPAGRGDFEFEPGLPQNHWITRNVPNLDVSFGGLVGYEADMYFPASASYPGRASTLVVGESDFRGPIMSISNAVYYTTTSGARVFGAGTIEWGLGLDNFGGDTSVGPPLHTNYYYSRVEITTTNILACLRDGGAACN